MSRQQWGHGFNAGMQAAATPLRGTKKPTTNATNTMLVWNPGTSDVKLVAWPDSDGRSYNFVMSSLACYSHFREASFEQRKCLVFIEAMHLIVRDRCDPVAVHNALLDLEEYRDGCADDMLRRI